MHLRRGEWHDAKYWARQIETLEREPCQYTPIPHEVVDTATSPSGPDGALTVFLNLPDNAATVPEDALAVEPRGPNRTRFGPRRNAPAAYVLVALVEAAAVGEPNHGAFECPSGGGPVAGTRLQRNCIGN
jgi:hypothetical protein